jgi:hypothetical protein
MNVDTLTKLIEATREAGRKYGRRFEITFIKKDGTRRTMHARLGVSKGVTGKGMSYDPAKYGLMTVWDTSAQGYRQVNLNTVIQLRLPDRSRHLRTVPVGYSRRNSALQSPK